MRLYRLLNKHENNDESSQYCYRLYGCVALKFQKVTDDSNIDHSCLQFGKLFTAFKNVYTSTVVQSTVHKNEPQKFITS